jgi:hypothetical protein
MDEPNAGAKPGPEDLEPRPPLEADLVALCRELWMPVIWSFCATGSANKARNRRPPLGGMPMPLKMSAPESVSCTRRLSGRHKAIAEESAGQ